MQSGNGGGWAYDIIPNWGAGFGNLFIGAHAGAQIRFGWNLPNDFGTSQIRPGSDTNAPPDKRDSGSFKSFHWLGVHVFAGVDGAYIPLIRSHAILWQGPRVRRTRSIYRWGAETFDGVFFAGILAVLLA